MTESDKMQEAIEWAKQEHNGLAKFHDDGAHHLRTLIAAARDRLTELLKPRLSDESSAREDAIELLRQLRSWANEAVGDSWKVHDRVNPVLFDKIDALLAAPAGEAVLASTKEPSSALGACGSEAVAREDGQHTDLIQRLRKRAEIRRSIPRGEPDRISDILEEAATALAQAPEIRPQSVVSKTDDLEARTQNASPPAQEDADWIDWITAAKRDLNEVCRYAPGYDWNVDPRSLTLKTGGILATLDKLAAYLARPASPPATSASAVSTTDVEWLHELIHNLPRTMYAKSEYDRAHAIVDQLAQTVNRAQNSIDTPLDNQQQTARFTAESPETKRDE